MGSGGCLSEALCTACFIIIGRGTPAWQISQVGVPLFVLGRFSMGEPVMTPAEVAEKYKIPKSTVSFWVVTQQIPFHRLSKRVVRFDEDELNAWWDHRKNISYRRAPYKKK
jgi:excisionase family DNA binding protein